jgi:hypothetical protein
MSSSLMFAQYAPLVLMSIMTIMMIEAAGSVDNNTMTPLPGNFILLKFCIQVKAFLNVSFLRYL